MLTEETLKYLITPDHFLPEYLSFTDNFKKWKKNVTCKYTNEPPLKEIITLDNEKIVDKANIVEYIVKNKCEDLIEKMYKSTAHLRKTEVRELLNSIVKYYVNNDLKIEKDLPSLANQISTLFPNESKVNLNYMSFIYINLNCYFQKAYFDIKKKPIKYKGKTVLRDKPTGKLYYKWTNREKKSKTGCDGNLLSYMYSFPLQLYFKGNQPMTNSKRPNQLLHCNKTPQKRP